jgi:RNA polymerase sigma factor (sigma-70 family)
MLRSVARSYRLSSHDVDDAVQATWINLFENIDRVRDTSRIAAWLATTVRRESLRLLQRGVREHLTDELEVGTEDRRDVPEAQLLEAEQRVVLTRAVATLPDRQRRLMTLIVSESSTTYAQIAAALDMPQGSIGPTRARGIARLRQDKDLREYAGAGCSRRSRRAGGRDCRAHSECICERSAGL